jgi:homopolymeric O-antigen transport system ATP-binding protein
MSSSRPGGVAIRIEGLGKRYSLRSTASPSSLLSDHLVAAVKGSARRVVARLNGGPAPLNAATSDFWALRDVDVAVQHGEVVGVIGRNGAGKSTLLKILSRITRPTTGRVELFGRVGALLEVGTGFHPELSGRDNVFLNGAILGMRRSEIARKFDEIVAFAEVATFIDTPVKFYSSGMRVRLAFAVAAHLETEILLVDEVLAVGDASFQKKCLGKMGDVARRGRTVVFVSHDLTAVQVLCQRAIRLSHGRVQGTGPVAAELQAYLAEARGTAGAGGLDRPIPLTERLRLRRFGFVENPIPSGSPASFEVDLESATDTHIYELAVLIHDALNRRVGLIDFRRPEGPMQIRAGQTLKLTARLAALPLVEGDYQLGASIRSENEHPIKDDLARLDVTAAEHAAFVPYQPSIRGLVAFDYAVQTR